MDGISSPLSQRRQTILWVVWLLCVGVWTVALLTTFPVQVQAAILPPQASYPTAKLLHVSSYAFLTAFAAWLMPGHKLRILTILFISLHAFTTEFLQTFTESRHGSLTDVGFNHIGITLGLLLTCWKWWPART